MIENQAVIVLGAGAIGGLCTILGSYLVVRNGNKKYIENTITTAITDIAKLQGGEKSPCNWHQKSFDDVYQKVEEKVKESNDKSDKLEKEFDKKTEKFLVKADKLGDAINSLDKTVAVLNQNLVNQQTMCERRGIEIFELHKKISRPDK